ncbi:hypothetical protein ACMHYB_25925 [Sorangium sp. So ce1128]
MNKVPRTIGILDSGAALAAAATFDAPVPRDSLSPVGWLHVGLPLYL